MAEKIVEDKINLKKYIISWRSIDMPRHLFAAKKYRGWRKRGVKRKKKKGKRERRVEKKKERNKERKKERKK